MCFEEAKGVLGLIGSVLAFFSMDFLGISRGQSPPIVTGRSSSSHSRNEGWDRQQGPQRPISKPLHSAWSPESSYRGCSGMNWATSEKGLRMCPSRRGGHGQGPSHLSSSDASCCCRGPSAGCRVLCFGRPGPLTLGKTAVGAALRLQEPG